MNKNILYILFFLLSVICNAQTALYNNGNLRIHENGQIGFHTNFINDNSLDQNLGLAGFYGDALISVSGNFTPTFYDLEIANTANVVLQTGINVANNANFIEGDFVTPRSLEDIYLNFLNGAFFNGESNTSKVDGYVAMNNLQSYSFPTGDQLQLRPLILNSDAVNIFASCAYFREDPSSPASIVESFDRDNRPRTLGEISTTEFWILNSQVPSSVTLSWNPQSNLVDIALEAEEITIVGWNINLSRWEDLGVTATSGDINQGFAISEIFDPTEFAALSFAGIPVPTDTFAVNNPTLGNYYISPNGDGLNDVLVFENIASSSINFIQIYDRFGLQVFEASNYTNEFDGISNINNNVIKRASGLPAGIYFYVIELIDLELNYQGFLYLSR